MPRKSVARTSRDGGEGKSGAGSDGCSEHHRRGQRRLLNEFLLVMTQQKEKVWMETVDALLVLFTEYAYYCNWKKEYETSLQTPQP